LSRLFIAVKVSAEIRQELYRLQVALFAGMPYARVVSPDNLHVTLRFLGEVKEERAADAVAACGRTAAAFAHFSMEISGVGSFPRKNPRVIWAGINDGSDYLIEVNKKLEALLVDAGFPADDKSYRPHLTLARLKPAWEIVRLKERLINLEGFLFGRQTVQDIVLMESRLGHDAPVYTEVACRPLSG